MDRLYHAIVGSCPRNGFPCRTRTSTRTKSTGFSTSRLPTPATATSPAESAPTADAPPADRNEALNQDEIEAILKNDTSDPAPAKPNAPTADSTPAASETPPAKATPPANPAPPSAKSAETPRRQPIAANVDDDDAISQGDIEFLLKQAEGALASADSTQPSLPGGASRFELKQFGGTAANDENATLDLIRDVELDVRIELGRTNMYLDDVLRLSKGSVVPLDKLAGDPVDVFVNGRLVARGEGPCSQRQLLRPCRRIDRRRIGARRLTARHISIPRRPDSRCAALRRSVRS